MWAWMGMRHEAVCVTACASRYRDGCLKAIFGFDVRCRRLSLHLATCFTCHEALLVVSTVTISRPMRESFIEDTC